MRIVFTLASLGSGGAERVVSLLANKMDEMGYQVEIVCLKFNDVYYRTNESVKVTLAANKNRLSELFWLRKHIKHEKPDVVIAFTEGVYCFTIASLLGTSIPVIASERLDPSAMSWKRNLLKRILLPYADWLVVQTHSIKEYFPANIQEKTSVIYNPVNEEFLTLPSQQMEKRLNRIISVGRLYPQKNQQMMIRAFAKIASQFPNWQLVIYGEGPLRENLEQLVNSLGMKRRILLPGRTENVVEVLRESKIFCMSSDYEGMSNSMIEAVSAGLPIITTRVSGTEEMIKDGKTGVIVDIGDEQGLSNAMSDLMNNDTLCAQLVERSIHTRNCFHIDTIISEWEGLIRKITNK